MRYFFLLLIVFITALAFGGVNIQSVDAAAIIRPPNNLGLVGYWSFDEGRGTQASDLSGNGNDGTLVNGPTWAVGKSKGGLDFDGSNDYVDVGNTGSLALTDYLTISTWVKFDDVADGTRVGNIVGNYNMSPNFNLEGHTTGRIRFYWNAGEVDLFSTKDIRSEWHHVVVVRNKTTNKITLYIDGVFESESTAGTNQDIQWPLRIGGDFRATPGIPLNGTVDDVRIYNRALSASEIQSLYTNTRSTVVGVLPTDRYSNGLVAHWTFDGKNTTVTTVEDIAGSNDGTINGAVPVAGKIGQAMGFDGVNDYIDAGAVGNFDADFTVSLWIKSDNYITSRGILTKTNAGSYWTTLGFSITNISNPKRPYLKITDGVNSVSQQLITEDEQYDWTFITVTRNDDTLTSYINGILLETDDLSAIGSINGSQNLFIGRGNSGAWDGSIDDVRIYNRALSANEVAGLYSATSSSKMQSSTDELVTSGLVGHWSFDASTISGTTVSDVSGNGLHGTIVGDSSVVSGKIEEALNFDGVDDYVNTGFQPNSATGALNYWLKLETQNGNSLTGVNDQSNHRLYLGSSSNGNIYAGYGNNYSSSLGSAGDVSPNKGWQMLTLTGDGSQAKVYLNGVEKGSFSYSFSGSSSANFYIGDLGGNSGFYTDGLIDDVRIYTRALTEEEITQLYNMGQ